MQHNLVGEEVGQDGKGGSVEARETLTEILVSEVVGMGRALEVDFVLSKRTVLTLRASLFVLQVFAAALVAFVINLGKE